MDPAHPEITTSPSRSYEITPRMRTWRQTLERCRSAAQVCLCLSQLERSIAWEKSVNKVVRDWGASWPRWVGSLAEGSPCLLTTLLQTCLVCRKGDNDEFLLLCDGCDRGCHIYCHRPKMEAVPEGDWFCAVCLAQVSLLLSHSHSSAEVRDFFLILFTTNPTNNTLTCLQCLLGKISRLGATRLEFMSSGSSLDK